VEEKDSDSMYSAIAASSLRPQCEPCPPPWVWGRNQEGMATDIVPVLSLSSPLPSDLLHACATEPPESHFYPKHFVLKSNNTLFE